MFKVKIQKRICIYHNWTCFFVIQSKVSVCKSFIVKWDWMETELFYIPYTMLQCGYTVYTLSPTKDENLAIFKVKIQKRKCIYHNLSCFFWFNQKYLSVKVLSLSKFEWKLSCLKFQTQCCNVALLSITCNKQKI